MGNRATAGSIPANAGEPSRSSSHATSPEVYPRERGGTATQGRVLAAELGLSPRTRGNPLQRAA